MMFRRVGAGLWVQGTGRARLERGIDTPSRHIPISSNVLQNLNRQRITGNTCLPNVFTFLVVIIEITGLRHNRDQECVKHGKSV